MLITSKHVIMHFPDLTKVNLNDMDGTMKLMNKNKRVLMFVQVFHTPYFSYSYHRIRAFGYILIYYITFFQVDARISDQREVDRVGMRWQQSLLNAHLDTERFVIEANRFLFHITDGAQAFEIRDFLTKQPECESVTFEGMTTEGPAYAFRPSGAPEATKRAWKDLEQYGTRDNPGERIGDKNLRDDVPADRRIVQDEL